jgi:hypothetical protein
MFKPTVIYTKTKVLYEILQVKEKDDSMLIQKETKQDQDGDDYNREKSQDHKLTKEYSKDKDTKQKSKSQKKKKLEPSLKWRALGMEEYKER